MDSIHEMDNIDNIYETDATEEEEEAEETNEEENSDDWEPHRFGFSHELEDYSELKESQSDGYSSDWESNSGSESVLLSSELMDDECDDDYARLTRVHIHEQAPRSLGAYIGSRIEPLLQRSHTIQVLKYFLYNLLWEVWIGYHTVVRILRDLLDAIKSILGYSYQYRDIEIHKRSLRLLILLPGSFHEDIRCHLIHTSLDEQRAHQYEALSYTWGPPEKNHFIWIDAYKFPVTANLHHALQHLRQDVVRFLWVDAICLNQENIQERNHQVKQMTMIYREASRVIVWLGPAGNYSDDALDFIPTLRSFRPSRQRSTVLSGRVAHKILTSLEAMAKLCQRPWWQRVWIIQEVASAKSEVVVQCGHTQWPWHAFVEGAKLMKEQREGLNLYDPLMPTKLFPEDTLYIISKLEGIRYGKKRGDLNLLYLLEETRGSQATDKRDHVYALLGLAPSHCTIGFETDYAKSTYQVYLDTARHLIQNRNDLSVFGSRLQDTDSNLPSWVTDWSKPYDGIQLLRDGTPYRAAGNSKASFRFLANPAHLAVRGVIIDKIHGLCHSTHLELFPWDNWVDRRMELSRRHTNLGNGKQPAMTSYIQIPRKSGFDYSQRANGRSLVEYNSKERFIEAYWRTLIGDSTREGEFPAPASFGRRFEVLHLEREIKDGHEAIQPWKSEDSMHRLATIIKECYPDSSREEWVRRLNSLRNESKRTLTEESGKHTQLIGHQYLAKDRGLNGEINGTTSEVGFADKESKSNTSMKPRAPIPPPIPEVPFAPKTVGSFTWDYSNRMAQVTRNRALFCTSKDYIGLASHFAQDGDKICVLLGCNTPVIIREKDDVTYELIGAAYLHGFMQGEALDYIERGEVELEVFVIS